MKLFLVAGHLEGQEVVVQTVFAKSKDIAQSCFTTDLIKELGAIVECYIDECLLLEDLIAGSLHAEEPENRVAIEIDNSHDAIIRSDIYQPKLVDEVESGYLEYVGQRTFGNVRDQLVEVLKSIYIPKWGHSAFSGIENIGYFNHPQNLSEEVPSGDLQVLVKNGSNEGYRIELLIQSKENNQIIPIISLKFLCDKDEVWEIGKLIDAACNRGYYGY